MPRPPKTRAMPFTIVEKVENSRCFSSAGGQTNEILQLKGGLIHLPIF